MTQTRERALEEALNIAVRYTTERARWYELAIAALALPTSPEPAPVAGGWTVGYGGTSCSVYPGPAHKVAWNKKNAIATFPRTPEGMASARAIAAAPAMLAALQAAILGLDTDGAASAIAALNTHGRAAIARATGKEG